MEEFQNDKFFLKSQANTYLPPCPEMSTIVLSSGLKGTLIVELLIRLLIKVWLFRLFSVEVHPDLLVLVLIGG